MTNDEDPLDALLDRACGIGPDGIELAQNERDEAVSVLTSYRQCNASRIAEFRDARLVEVIRDETGRIRGCSTPGCVRAAVWDRTFVRILTSGGKLAIAGSWLVAGAFGANLHAALPSCEFDRYRLGQSNDRSNEFVHQFGCWAHIHDFLLFPPKAGRFNYDIFEANLPNARPDFVFAISDEIWGALKTAETAMKLGMPEGERGFCTHCGLPHDFGNLKGTLAGEGDDFWRVFCAYCKTELHPDSPV